MLIFYDLGEDLSDIRTRFGLLYMCINAEAYIFMLVLIEKYTKEIRVFDREFQDKNYSVLAYLISSWLAALPQLILIPCLFGLPIYYGCSLREYDSYGLSPNDPIGNDPSSLDDLTGNGYSPFYVLRYLSVIILIITIINNMALFCVALHREFAINSLIGKL